MSTQGSTDYRRPESVLVVVYADQQVLLLERRQPQGFWQSVTGSLEQGETPQACARRELKEETGLDADPVNMRQVNRFEIMPQWRERYAPEVTHNLEHVFSLSLECPRDVVLSPDEHTRYAWLDAQAAAERCFSSTNAEAIRQIISGI